MENVKIADAKVDQLRALLVIGESKTKVAVPMDVAIGFLQSLERLAALERHLQNLTSDTFYKNN